MLPRVPHFWSKDSWPRCAQPAGAIRTLRNAASCLPVREPAGCVRLGRSRFPKHTRTSGKRRRSARCSPEPAGSVTLRHGATGGAESPPSLIALKSPSVAGPAPRDSVPPAMKRVLLILALLLLPVQTVLADLCGYGAPGSHEDVATAVAQDADNCGSCCAETGPGSLPGAGSGHCTACSAGHFSAPGKGSLVTAHASRQNPPAYTLALYDPGLAARIERVPLIVS